MKRLTYKRPGVDTEGEGVFQSRIPRVARSSFSADVLKDIGGFGSFFKFSQGKFKEPVLVSSADGVGTKLKVAFAAGIHDTVGIDAVAMNVNDILCAGATPLFFLDYIAYSKVDPQVLFQIIRGLNRGCIEAGCSLVGGETAQMPGMYRQGEYDLAGFCVGVVEKKDIIDGSKIKAGDVVIGLESNGLHSNGFSLVRKALSQDEVRRMSRELLKPTRIYVKPLLSLLRDKRLAINGLSHITGGAFYDKIARILPENLNARIHKNSWLVPPIFRLIQKKGGIEDKEMYHVLNMGIGMCLIASPRSSKVIMSKLAGQKIRSWFIGEIVKGRKKVEIL